MGEQFSLNGVRGKEIRKNNRRKIRQRKAEKRRRNEKENYKRVS